MLAHMVRSRRLLPLWLVPVLALALALALGACGDDDASVDAGGAEGAGQSPAAAGGGQAELEHVHGLGVEPGSGTLYVATHYGLFKAATGETKLERAGPSRQDVMGFSVVGPRRFIGSGHPDPIENLPPNLGLIESRDRGKSWKNISLLGEADFHVLRSAGPRVYGFNSTTGKLMVSSDGGREWAERAPPAGVVDLAIDPADSRRIVASTERGTFVSPDGGNGWRPLDESIAGLLAWPAPKRLFLIDAQGRVSRSADAGKSFEAVGTIGGQPAAFVNDRKQLYAALGDGRVMRSSDGGANWAVRAGP